MSKQRLRDAIDSNIVARNAFIIIRKPKTVIEKLQSLFGRRFLDVEKLECYTALCHVHLNGIFFDVQDFELFPKALTQGEIKSLKTHWLDSLQTLRRRTMQDWQCVIKVKSKRGTRYFFELPERETE